MLDLVAQFEDKRCQCGRYLVGTGFCRHRMGGRLCGGRHVLEAFGGVLEGLDGVLEAMLDPDSIKMTNKSNKSEKP